MLAPRPAGINIIYRVIEKRSIQCILNQRHPSIETVFGKQLRRSLYFSLDCWRKRTSCGVSVSALI